MLISEKKRTRRVKRFPKTRKGRIKTRNVIKRKNNKRRKTRRRGGMLQGISPPMDIPKTRNEPREPRRQVVGSRSNKEIIKKLERDNQDLRYKLNECIMSK